MLNLDFCREADRYTRINLYLLDVFLSVQVCAHTQIHVRLCMRAHRRQYIYLGKNSSAWIY